MAATREDVLSALAKIILPGGQSLVDADLIRALSVDTSSVRFVIEASDADAARALVPVKEEAESALAALPGVTTVQIAITAHTQSHGKSAKPPSLKIGGHPKPAPAGPQKVAGVDRILAIGSGKGGVGKSTVSSNLAVALARQGRRVGLLDADIYGPSQPRMMGVNKRPASPDGKIIEPLHAHGVTLMSIGLMLAEEKAVVWRGPMLMGALQQMLSQTRWGELDVLIVDLPPGTGDVAMTLCQRSAVTGAVVVSTPQDVALLDARKALDMFNTLNTPVLGLIENMSSFCCPECGHEAHIFGHGGVRKEAERIGVPFLGELPISLETRLAGDDGAPIATGDSSEAEAYARLAHRFIAGGMA